MWRELHTPKASRLRQRTFAVIDRVRALQAQLSGPPPRSDTRCEKPRSRCAQGKGHPAWSLTYMVKGRRQVERIPAEWAKEVERRVAAGRELQDAVKEVLTANVQLLVLAKQQEQKGKK